MSQFSSKSRGFTLIETLVYLALYAIIILGALSASYSMFESSARNQTIALIEEEGSYLIGKIDWILGNSTSVISPAAQGNRLEIIDSEGDDMSVWSSVSRLKQKINNNSEDILSNSNVSVLHLTFGHAVVASDGFSPESIAASFTLVSTTSDGHVLSRDFSLVRYMHS